MNWFVKWRFSKLPEPIQKRLLETDRWEDSTHVNWIQHKDCNLSLSDTGQVLIGSILFADRGNFVTTYFYDLLYDIILSSKIQVALDSIK